MNVKDLFTGIAVVVDDEVDERDAGITKVINCIEEAFDIKCLKLSKRPQGKSVKPLSEATMVILDWKLNCGISSTGADTFEIKEGATLEEENDRDNVKLIQEILEESLVPIFVVTNDAGAAREALKRSGIAEVGGRVSVVDKGGLTDSENLERYLEKWLEQNHESYVLKEWECTAKNAKTDFFKSFGKERVKWADTLWARIKKDDKSDCRNMFGEYLTRCIVNRMDDFAFDPTVFKEDCAAISSNEIISDLVNAEKMKRPAGFPDHPRSGDLYYRKRKFLLNVRADCDTARSEDAKKTGIYYIEGSLIDAEQLEPPRSVIVEDGKSYLYLRGQQRKVDKLKSGEFEGVDEILTGDQIPLKEIDRAVVNSELNHNFLNRRLDITPPVINVYGKLRSSGGMYYLPLKIEDDIDEKLKGRKIVAIRFKLDLKTKKYGEIAGDEETKSEYKYYGRLLSPYINEIQQECAKWCFRIGAMPVPDEFYTQEISDS